MEPDFRLMAVRDPNDKTHPCLRVDGKYYSLGKLYSSVREIVEDWDENLSLLRKLAGNPEGSNLAQFHADEIRFAPPIMYPGALYCAGANYLDHLIEMSGSGPTDDQRPYFFLKSTRGTIVGANDDIVLPERSGQVDWEAEIGLVVGRQAHNVSEKEAMDHIAGFVVLNDLSARDHMKRTDVPFLFDWIGQKCFDTGCPMGPWITPRSAIRDINSLDIQVVLNGEIQQDSNTRQMIFPPEALVSYLSSHLTLYPGDVIATGTPAGCGMPRGLFLKDGDLIVTRVEGLGELVNHVKASC